MDGCYGWGQCELMTLCLTDPVSPTFPEVFCFFYTGFMRWIFVCTGRVESVGPSHKRKPNRVVAVADADDGRRAILGKNLSSRERTPCPHTFSDVKSCLDDSWRSEVGCFPCRPSSPKNRPCCADEVVSRSPSTKPEPTSLLYHNSIAACK